MSVIPMKKRDVMTSDDLTEEEIEHGLKVKEEIVDLLANGGSPLSEEYCSHALLQTGEDEYVYFMQADRIELKLHEEFLEKQKNEFLIEELAYRRMEEQVRKGKTAKEILTGSA